MLKKKWLWVSIVVVVISVIGGKVYMNKKEGRNKEKEQIEQVQKELSLYIVQHYTDVKKIEFKQITYNDMTGSWRFTTRVNDVNVISFSVSDLDNVFQNLTTVLNPEKINLSEEINEKRELKNVDLIFNEVEE